MTPFPNVVSPTAQIEELRKRDARILDAYEKGAITEVDELRARRESIRRGMAMLQRMQEPKKGIAGTDLGRLARTIVKAALRYSRITDLARKQQIIRDIFSEIHVRNKQIVSCRFRAAILGPTSEEGPVTNTTVLLPNTIHIGPESEVLKEGFRRCIKCNEVKPTADYYRNLGACRSCRTKDERQRHLRRKQRKAASKGTASYQLV